MYSILNTKIYRAARGKRGREGKLRAYHPTVDHDYLLEELGPYRKADNLREGLELGERFPSLLSVV